MNLNVHFRNDALDWGFYEFHIEKEYKALKVN